MQIKTKMDNEIAVWDGRFQPLHKGHVEVIKAIVSQFESHLVIMIIQSSEGIVDDYSKDVNQHHRLSRNPLTFWERFRMLELALENEAVKENVNILGIPRPDLYWDISRSFYPDKRFICLTGKDDYEKSKAVFWFGLGEKTRTIDTQGLSKISATEFKTALKNGRNWERFLPENTIQFFKDIDGPNRFKFADI